TAAHLSAKAILCNGSMTTASGAANMSPESWTSLELLRHVGAGFRLASHRSPPLRQREGAGTREQARGRLRRALHRGVVFRLVGKTTSSQSSVRGGAQACRAAAGA